MPYNRQRNAARHRVVQSLRNRIMPGAPRVPPPHRIAGARRRSRRGPGRGGSGSGAALMVPSRAPTISRLERDLDKLGVDVQRYRQFRSEERVKVFPKSGHCNWYCVPDYMDYGNSMTVTDLLTGVAAPLQHQAYVVKPTPNTCDLYDIYKNITAGLGVSPVPGGVGFIGGDTTQNPDQFLATGSEALLGRRIQMPFGTQHTVGSSFQTMVPGALRVVKPGMDYTIKTHISYDNVSSLDAFVEVYKLTYKPPVTGWDRTAYAVGSDYHINVLHAASRFGRMPMLWQGTNATHPGAEFCPVPDLAAPEQRSAGCFFGGGLLKAYCDAAIYQRTHPFSSTVTGYTGGDSGVVGGDFQTVQPQGFYETQHLEPAAEGGTAGTNAAGRGSMGQPVLRKMIVCHPKIDPVRVTPRGRPTSELGFTLERIQGPRRVKPGGHARFELPNKGVRHWQYSKSPIGKEHQDSSGVGTAALQVGYAEVYCFRVWGDMIHGKTALTDGFETDFQTGSTAVTFQTLRTVWARVRPRVNTIVNPALLPFDADVAFDQQEQINEESDRPELIMHAGDGVVNPT